MEKTIEEWYKDLPKDVREKAIHNVNNLSYEGTLEEKTEDLASALMMGFLWRKSPEGHDYWSEQHTKSFGD